MNKISALYIILFAFSCRSDEQRKNIAKEYREVITKFENGTPEIVHVYENIADSSNYHYEKYYLSGAKEITGEIIENEQSGIWTWWYENGNKEYVAKFKNSYLVDTTFSWYENGILEMKRVFVKSVKGTFCCDTCDAWFNIYYANGKPKEEKFLENNMYQGVAKFYDTLGGVRIRNFVNDILEGKTLELNYEPSGLEIVFGQYKNGKETGQWNIYDRYSKPIQTINFINGVLNGIFIKYHPNGKIKKKGRMLDGYFDGTIEYYDENGNLTKTEKFEDGEVKQTLTY